MFRNFRRVPVPSRVAHKGKSKSFPAPVRGLVTNSNLGVDGPLSCRVLENFFPDRRGLMPRGGRTRTATLEAEVKSMWSYKGHGIERWFMATETEVFINTAISDKDVKPTASVTGQTAGYYSVAHMSTGGTTYQFCCNGDDDPLKFDGSSFVAHGLTAASGNIDALDSVWVHGSRLWFTEKDTLDAYYMAVDSIAGALNQFTLNGVFKRGGTLLMGTTWSGDSGSGQDDRCVFVSSEGEIAVYSGDPASTFSLIGVYDVAPVLGKRAFYHIGGVPYFLTVEGISPLTDIVTRDKSDLSVTGTSEAIKDLWDVEVARRRLFPWEVGKWSTKNKLFISQPRTSTDESAPHQCIVGNLETGAWTLYTNWDVQCFTVFDDGAYFGDADGGVWEMEFGGNDDGASYTCKAQFHHDHLGAPGVVKTTRLARGNFVSKNAIDANISVETDYGAEFPAAPNSISDFDVEGWDDGNWDESVWDGTNPVFSSVSTSWQSVRATGFMHAVQCQMTYGVNPKPQTILVSIDLVFEDGGLVV